MEEPIILCDNLVKIYKIAGLEVVALQGLDLAVAKGELIGIVGASGSGKSTLLNILGGLDRPSAGRVWVNGKSLLEMSDGALTEYRRTQVGFVWQQGARNLIPFLTAVENVELPMTLAGQPARPDAPAGGRAAGGRWPVRPAQFPPARAVRRRAAARGDCGGPIQPAGDAAGRRAHRRAGYRQRPDDL